MNNTKPARLTRDPCTDMDESQACGATTARRLLTRRNAAVSVLVFVQGGSAHRGVRGLLLPVSLDGAGVARCGLIGIGAGVPEGPSLAQQVPADVELDLNGTQALRICLERLGFILLLSGSQRVLLFNKALDSRSDAFIAHDRMLRLHDLQWTPTSPLVWRARAGREGAVARARNHSGYDAPHVPLGRARR